MKDEKLSPVSADGTPWEKGEVVPTISLAFTLADEYYPHQEYSVFAPNKEYELPGIVGYGVYSSRFRTKEAGLERAVPFIDEDSVTASVEAGKLALIHSGVDSKLIGKVYAGSESNPYAVKPIACKSCASSQTRGRRRGRPRR